MVRRLVNYITAILAAGAAGVLVVAPSTMAGALPLGPGVQGVTVNAGAPNFDITLDCVEFLGSYAGLTMPARPGETLTVHSVNCENHFFDVTTPWPLGNPPGYNSSMTGSNGEGTWTADYWYNPSDPVSPVPQEFVLQAGTFVYIDNAPNNQYKPIDFHAVAPLDDPQGELAYSQTVSLTAGSSEFTIADGNWNHYLNGDNLCRLRSGTHVYATVDLTIETDGLFTFRYAAATPDSYYLYNWLDSNPSNDGFIALYSNFDPTNPDANVVGCNDDLNGEFSYADQDYSMFVDSAGKILSSKYPQFTTNLEAGNYTLVLTQYDQHTASDWSTVPYAASAVTFEMWGPDGGFAIPEYSIEFDSQGGSECEPISENLATPLNLPTPNRPGYQFDGWFTQPEGGDQAPDGTLMPSPVNITLYAHWSEAPATSSSGGNLAETGANQAQPMIFAVLAISASIGIVVFRRRARLS